MNYITVTQASEISGVSRQAIHKAIARGELNKIDIAGKLFVDREQVRIWRQRPRAGARGRPKPAQASKP